MVASTTSKKAGVSSEQPPLAIEIVEHTLEALYEIPEKALELKKRMATRKK
jgi:hypothetical protein